MVTTLAVVYFAPNIFPIKTEQIENNAITADKVATDAVITTKLADGSITSAKIMDGTVTAVDIVDGAIIEVKIANGSITNAKVADGAITSAKIAENAIITVKLADGSVTSAKILDGAVTAIDLATNAITTIKIVDGAVTTSKIADEAVTNVKLASQAIPFVSTQSSSMISTTETAQYIDMNGMSVTLSLNRSSHILIMFSVQALPDWDERIYVRTLVGEDVAYPGEIFLTPIVFGSDANSYLLGWGAYTYVFYQPSASAGTYTIKIQWKVSGGTGDVADRTLTVIGLPA